MTETGTIKATLASAIPGNCGITSDVRGEMYNHLGREYVVVAVLKVAAITTPSGDDGDGDPAVKLRVLDLEVGQTDDEDGIREVIQAWYRRRTARDTFDDIEPNPMAPTPSEQADSALKAIEANTNPDIIDAEIVDTSPHAAALRAEFIAAVKYVVSLGYLSIGKLARELDVDDDRAERLAKVMVVLGIATEFEEDGAPHYVVNTTADLLDETLADIHAQLNVVFPDNDPAEETVTAEVTPPKRGRGRPRKTTATPPSVDDAA